MQAAGQLRYEWRRVVSLRSTWIMVSVAIFAAISVGYGTTVSSEGPQPDTQQILITGVSWPVLIPIVVVAIQSFGHDYRYGTLVPFLLSFPRRWETFFVKFAVTVAICTGVLALCLVSLLLLSSTYSQAVPSADNPWHVVGRALTAGACIFAIFACSVAVTRSYVLGPSVALGWALAGELMLPVVFGEGAEIRWWAAPFTAAREYAAAAVAIDPLYPPPTQHEYLVILLLWVGLLISCAAYRFNSHSVHAS